MSLPEHAQEVKFASILIEEIVEVQKHSVIYKNIQGEIFLAEIGKLVCVPSTLIFFSIL